MFRNASVAMVSGWMLTPQTPRSRSVEIGFPLSDHADWPGLLKAIDETRAEQIFVTHGQPGTIVRWLNENGKFARALGANNGLQNE